MTLRIAYISFEHPEGIAGGGIGTYVGQVSKVMANMGHSVEVFAATRGESVTRKFDNYLLHLIPADDNHDFSHKVVGRFETRHLTQKFDLIESAEYGADGLNIKKKFPVIPLFLKLHTPTFLTNLLNDHKRGYFDKLRFIAGAILRLQRVKFYWRYNKDQDPEFELYNYADKVSSPSASLTSIVKKKWGAKHISLLRYPYVPDPKLLELPILPSSDRLVVAFIGKLERRKGILDILTALPAILEKKNNIDFHFIGAIHSAPGGKEDIRQYAERKLSKYRDHLHFMGLQPPSALPSLLKNVDVCLFPSIWENFPFVCLESMAAGKAVIGSNSGGMAEMLTHLKTGFLIAPKDPDAITKAVLALANNADLRVAMGENAREEIIQNYNADFIGQQTEDFYAEVCKQTLK